MQKSALALWAMLLLLDTAAAEVSYRKFRMSSWEYRAKSCGETYQSYVAENLEHLLPGMPGIIWEAAREKGAEEEEIEVLKERFDEGRKLALEKEWVRKPDLEPSEFYLEMRTNHASFYLKFCTKQPLD